MNEEADMLSKRAFLQFIKEKEKLVKKYYDKYLSISKRIRAFKNV